MRGEPDGDGAGGTLDGAELGGYGGTWGAADWTLTMKHNSENHFKQSLVWEIGYAVTRYAICSGWTCKQKPSLR